MIEIACGVLMLLGAFFLLLAAIGVYRMPDLFTRMSPATKGSTLGVMLMLLAVAAFFADLGVTSRALAAIVFFFLTAPVTAHMVGRAAYIVGTPLWEGTVVDELRGCHAAWRREENEARDRDGHEDADGAGQETEPPVTRNAST